MSTPQRYQRVATERDELRRTVDKLIAALNGVLTHACFHPQDLDVRARSVIDRAALVAKGRDESQLRSAVDELADTLDAVLTHACPHPSRLEGEALVAVNRANALLEGMPTVANGERP